MIVFVVVLTATIIFRILIYGSRMSPWGVIASVVLVLFEIAMLRVVDRCLRGNKDLPSGLWFFTVLFEITFPAFGIAFLSSPRLEVAYRSLATPWVLAFFPFLILSVLRLSPRACRIGGIVAALSFFAAAAYHGYLTAVVIKRTQN